MSRRSKAAEFVDEEYDIHVTGRHVQVTEAMKDYAIEKISKMEKYNTRIIDVVVTMDIQKLDHRVDITMRANQFKIKAHAITEDMYASIDGAVDKLRRQLLKYKSKMQDYHAKHGNASHVDMNVNILSLPEDELYEFNEAIEAHNNEQKKSSDAIVVHAKETRPLKTLTVAEAVMKIDLSSDHFLIFRSEEDRKLKVIYRRKDGSYGIIEPEV